MGSEHNGLFTSTASATFHHHFCFTGIKDCSADVLGPVVPLAVIFLVATGIGTVCVVCMILKRRKSSGCTEVTSSDEESSRSRPRSLTMIGV